MTQTPKNNQQNATKGCAVLVVLAVILIIIFANMCSSSEPESTEHSETMALIMSRRFVEKRLKAPATAEFSNSVEGVTKINDSTFMVNSYVDAENSFGAKLRNQYQCRIVFLHDGQVQCEDLIVE